MWYRKTQNLLNCVNFNHCTHITNSLNQAKPTQHSEFSILLCEMPSTNVKNGRGGPKVSVKDRLSPPLAKARLIEQGSSADTRRWNAASPPSHSATDGCRTATPQHVSSYLTYSWDWMYGAAPPTLIPYTSSPVKGYTALPLHQVSPHIRTEPITYPRRRLHLKTPSNVPLTVKYIGRHYIN